MQLKWGIMMKELYENTKQFILKNYGRELDEETLDILTVSTMSLFIRFPEVSKAKFPEIFSKLDIHFGNKHIRDLVGERYPEYPLEEITDTTNAFVTRAMSLEDDNTFTEEWSMFISTNDLSKRLVNVIAKSTHELIHLLRFNGIVDSETEAKVRDGVSIARCNKATKVVKRKHYNLEEGIVEDFTIHAMESLFDFVKNEDISFSPALTAMKTRFKKDFKPSYDLERFFLDGLTRDKKFSELLEYSFVDTSEPLQVITYYNDTVGNASGFTSISRGLDKVVDAAQREDIPTFKRTSDELIKQINGFLAKSKR